MELARRNELDALNMDLAALDRKMFEFENRWEVNFRMIRRSIQDLEGPRIPPVQCGTPASSQGTLRAPSGYVTTPSLASWSTSQDSEGGGS